MERNQLVREKFDAVPTNFTTNHDNAGLATTCCQRKRVLGQYGGAQSSRNASGKTPDDRSDARVPTKEIQMPAEQPMLLRPREAAEWLAISERKLWSLTQSEEIKAIKVGRSVRYDLRDLLAWIEYKKSIFPSTKK